MSSPVRASSCLTSNLDDVARGTESAEKAESVLRPSKPKSMLKLFDTAHLENDDESWLMIEGRAGKMSSYREL